MKKIILLFALLFATITFSQEVFTTQVKMKQTPSLAVPDSVVTKDANGILRTTSLADLTTVLLPIFSGDFVDKTTNQTIAGTKTFNDLELGGNIDANQQNIIDLSELSFNGSGVIGDDGSKLKLNHNTQVEIASSVGTANIIVSGSSITTGLTNTQINNAGSTSMVQAGWVQNEIATSGGGGSLEYQTETTLATTVLDGTQEGLNKIYPFNLTTAQTVQVDAGDYVINDVVNVERWGQGSVEILAGTGVSIRGVRDINNRYFIDDSNSLISLLARGGEEFSIIGNLTRGYTGAVITTSYSTLTDGDVNAPITVIGTGFSSNMKDPVLTGNATLVSWSFVNSNQITLNITETGIIGDLITVTYDNGDVFEDTDAISISSFFASGLKRYYRLEDNANDFVGTLHGTSNNITYNGTDGDFSGTTSYIDIPDDDSLSWGDGATDSDMTITFMANFDVINGNWLISKYGQTANREYRLNFVSTTELLFQSRDESVPATDTETFNPHGLSTATWYHVGITKVGTTVKMYINGVLQTTSNAVVGVYTAMENGTSGVRIGAKLWDASVDVFDGKMKGVGFWNKALDDAEMLNVATEQLAGNQLL